MSCQNPARTLALLVAAGASAVVVNPATAQDASEEIVVMGRFGPVPDSVRSLSQPVSYADLDLSTQAGRAELRRRVSLTSRYLCEKLGESYASGPVMPSCRESATRDAMARIGTIEQNFVPRGTTWVAPPAWAPPYPADWVRRYP